jgi:hypothetical protein
MVAVSWYRRGERGKCRSGAAGGRGGRSTRWIGYTRCSQIVRLGIKKSWKMVSTSYPTEFIAPRGEEGPTPGRLSSFKSALSVRMFFCPQHLLRTIPTSSRWCATDSHDSSTLEPAPQLSLCNPDTFSDPVRLVHPKLTTSSRASRTLSIAGLNLTEQSQLLVPATFENQDSPRARSQTRTRASDSRCRPAHNFPGPTRFQTDLPEISGTVGLLRGLGGLERGWQEAP